jgi:hypothetical protein
MATVIDEHLGPGETVLLYDSYLRGLPFYLGRSVLLWNATFVEFGHEVRPRQSQYALQRDPETLAELIRARSTLLILAGDAQKLDGLSRDLGLSLEVLHREGRYTLARARSSPRGAGSSP